MKLKTKTEAAGAKERALAYEASMAIEGFELSAEGRRLADEIDAEGLGYEDGVARVKADLHRRGVIPAEGDEPSPLAAE